MSKDDSNNCRSSNGSTGAAGAVYGLGLIGALIYFISTATTFWIGVLGVFESACLAGIPCL